MYIDAHCHLADVRFNGIRSQVIDRSKAAGVTKWIQGGVCPEDWEKQLLLQKEYGQGYLGRVWFASGLGYRATATKCG